MCVQYYLPGPGTIVCDSFREADAAKPSDNFQHTVREAFNGLSPSDPRIFSIRVSWDHSCCKGAFFYVWYVSVDLGDGEL